MTVDHHSRECVLKLSLQCVPEVLHPAHHGLPLLDGKSDGSGKTNSQGDILCPRSSSSLLTAPEEDRFPLCFAPDIQRADSFGPVNLVRRDGQKLNSQIIHMERDLADGLHRICVHRHATRAGDAADLRDRLDCSHFIVGMHDGDKRGVRPQRLFHRLCRKRRLVIHTKHGDVRPLFAQVQACIQDSMVLGRFSDQMVAMPATGGLQDSENRNVVRFRPPAGKDHLRRLRRDRRRDSGPRLFQCILRLPAIPVCR